mmetsp:Transcript_4854/g.15266  ORF Transcript_4854/g.15266 Transcript_4854/m.15266 type:complete len:615 (-) Transcript_4854:92-1936(-)
MQTQCTPMATEGPALEPSLLDGSRAALCEPLHEAEFPVDERASELAPGLDEGYSSLLSAFAEQEALVKTVQNDGWVQLIRELQGPPLRTSLTLPPPGGRGMRFFGKPPESSLGLVWDRKALDLSAAHIWPSGYFAKSDFNVAADGSLLNGRAEALVTLEDLMHSNSTLTYTHMGRGTVTGEVMPYNEVLGPVHGATGIVAIFARSTRVVHLLFAMGIRALLARTLPGVGMLPILMHDPENGVRPFGRRAQSVLVSEYFTCPKLTPRSKMQVSGLSCLPVDSHLLDLGELEQLVFQGAYGITEEALAALVDVLLREEEEVQQQQQEQDIGAPDGWTKAKARSAQTRAFLALGLRAAVEADNAASALALVRHVAPLLVAADTGCADGPLALTLHRCQSSSAVPVSREGEDFATYLHRLAEQTRSSNVLVPVGAAIALEEFASGHMLPRIRAACQKLEAWLHDSTSVLFRLKSWHELHAHHVASESPDIKSFVTHHAIANRRQFYNALLELKEFEKDHDVLHGMAKLAALVNELHHPCMRLQLLQEILGLDERYDLETVTRVASLALQVVNDALRFGGAAPAKQQALSPRTQSFAPGFQLDAAAARIQGLDREDKLG